MFIVQILAFLILLLVLAWKCRIQLVEAIPVGCSLLIFLLYVLSFFRALSFSDVISCIVAAVTFLLFFKLPKEKRREVLGFVKEELLRPAALTAFFMTLAVTLCVSGKVVSWWDDYNFWATDAKSLFYLDGFAGKYMNAAAEFGDYPPGTQMLKWWFLHFSPGEFKEGLMFAGYYFMNLAFLFPMLKIIKKRNILQMAAGAAILWLFPAVAETFWCNGCCADLTMAVVYGAFLTAVADSKGHSRRFYYGRQALFLMVLVLCKNTGFIWAAFGLLFDYGYHLLTCRKEYRSRDVKAEGLNGKWSDRRALFAVTLMPVVSLASWLSFCLFNRRVAKLTGTAVKMAAGEMHIPAYQEEMVNAFVNAFVNWPLHKWKTIAVDLSPLSLYLLLLVFVFMLYKFKIFNRRKACYVGGFLAVSGAGFYSINLLSHLTIFAVETQYLQPFGMASSIERYGAPFTIGGLYLLAFYAMKGRRPAVGALICMAFILLTTDYKSAYQGLTGYKEAADAELVRRGELVDGQAQEFLKKIGAGGNESIGRVLYLRDQSDVSWVRNTYIGFEAAPVSVMYGNVDADVVKEQDIINAIKEAHAGFLYVDQLAGEKKEAFDALTGGEEFEYGRLYQVVEQAEGQICLTGVYEDR